MTRAVVLLLALLTGTALWGQGIYDVEGVAADDALFVRAAPATDGEVVGILQHDASGVRVSELSQDGQWGRVDHQGASGWASTNFLRAQTADFPDTLNCTGTEPFWSLAIRPDEVSLDEMSGAGFSGTAGTRERAEGRTDRWSLRAFDDGQSLTAVIGRGQCSDGMSDRTYPFGLDLILSTEDGHRHLSGCCARP